MQAESQFIKTAAKEYLFKYLNEFRSNLDKAMHEYDQEAIHDYRVAVKRIRAIIRAFNKIYDEPVFPMELINPLRMMFKAGGTIRDDQVQIELDEGLETEKNFAFP